MLEKRSLAISLISGYIYVSWFSLSWKLSTTELLAHSSTVGQGKEL